MADIELIPVFVEEMPSLYENGKIYISEEYKVAKHLCACGCDNMTVMPFEFNKSPSGQRTWGYENDNGVVTFYGSVGNYCYPCKSHYNIIRNKVQFYPNE